jgi:hypothetical protein
MLPAQAVSLATRLFEGYNKSVFSAFFRRGKRRLSETGRKNE